MDGAANPTEQSILSNADPCGGEAYARMGWSVIPVPHQSKNPGFKGWEQMRLTPETLDQHFNGHRRISVSCWANRRDG